MVKSHRPVTMSTTSNAGNRTCHRRQGEADILTTGKDQEVCKRSLNEHCAMQRQPRGEKQIRKQLKLDEKADARRSASSCKRAGARRPRGRLRNARRSKSHDLRGMQRQPNNSEWREKEVTRAARERETRREKGRKVGLGLTWGWRPSSRECACNPKRRKEKQEERRRKRGERRGRGEESLAVFGPAIGRLSR